MVSEQGSGRTASILNEFSRSLRERIVPRTAQSYEYTPLERSSIDVRFVRLLPSHFDDTICIELIVQSLENVSYEALSYVWGPVGLDSKPTVSVLPFGRTIQTTPNLAEALRYLRLEDSARMLWIDALSINQQDAKEKSEQVRRMASIYSAATGVVAWIGKEDEMGLARVAFDCFRTIGAHVSADWVLWALKPRTGDLTWGDKDLPTPLDAAQLNAAVHIFQRPWWSRLWIWQEIQLGSDRAILMCGQHTIHWKSVCDSIYVLRYKAYPVDSSTFSAIEFLETNPQMDYICSLCDAMSLDLLSALHRSRLAKCTDSRDRVYGVLSIVHRSGFDINLYPNYHKVNTPARVFTQAASAHISSFGNLDPLLHVGGSQKMRNLPSWAPNWNDPGVPYPFGYFDAGRGSAPDSFISRRTLHVKARLVASVEDAAQAYTSNKAQSNIQEIAEFLPKMVAQIPGLIKAIRAGDSFTLDMLCRVLCGNRLADRVANNDGQASLQWPTMQECAVIITQVLTEHGPIDNLRGAKTICGLIIQHCTGRTLFRSKKGRLGLAPADIRAGDIIAVMPGCKAAVALRRACFKRYHVVGAAYFEGFMSGEGILGNLPAFIEPVIVLKQTKQRWKYGFRDKSTGLVSSKDPRLQDPTRRAGPHNGLRYIKLV